MEKFLSLIKYYLLAILTVACYPAEIIAQSDSEVTGRWNITVQLPDGDFPGWLEIKRSGFNTMTGRYVGSEGSARPISRIHYSEENQVYSFSIPPQWKRIDEELHFEFALDGDNLTGTTQVEDETLNWTAVRAPHLDRTEPPVWGNPVSLLDENMSKWTIPENNKFQMENGILVNSEVGGNLVSTEKFEDFKLHAEFRYPEGSNSGIYLRGRYEVQIADQHGRRPNDQMIGGVYGFITPSVNAAKKADEWQTMDVTLVGRMVTVVLNGVEVISNQAIPGITGGALDSNEGEPGPIMIQGDHGPVDFRKLVITPSTR